VNEIEMPSSETPSTATLKSLFSESFQKYSVADISRFIKENGYFTLESAIDDNLVQSILSETAAKPLGLNINDVSPVRYHRQTFFAHILASSPTLVKLISDPLVLQLCRTYLGSKFRLKCQRYYESGFGYQLGWHTDNKTVDNKKTDVKGLVFIIYLTDTFDGELQVVRGSNNWSGDSLINDFEDADLRRDHPEKILSLPGKSGTIVITDTYTVHRTKMITTEGFRRKSLFFQIDDDLLHSEKIIVNTEFLPPMTSELMRFFGFGLPSGYKSMPQSNMTTLTSSDLVKVITGSSLELLRRVRGVRAFGRMLKSTPKKK
jgi:hypothetical protein